MQHTDKSLIKKYYEAQEDINVSIYISTAKEEPKSKEQKNKIKLKNKIKTAKEDLLNYGFKEKEADEFLKPAYDKVEDYILLRNLGQGLVMFLNNNIFEYFTIPDIWHDFSYVGNEFYLAPLLPPVIENKSFYILSLDLHGVKLFKADRFSISEIEVAEFVPERIEEAIGFDFKDKIFHHKGGPEPQSTAVHAKGDEEKKKERLKFLQHVSNGLMEILSDKSEPLIVASVDYIFSLFREICDYKFLKADHISESPKEDKKADLHEQAWKIIEKDFKQEIQDEIQRYNEVKTNYKSAKLKEIVPHALEGRLQTLFINKEAHEWGNLDNTTFEVTINTEKQPGDKELLNYAALNAFFINTRVFFLKPEELPEKNQKISTIYQF